MRDVKESFEREVNGITFMVNIVCFGWPSDLFDERWELSARYKSGVTIANPHADRNSYAYGIPHQVSLAELTAEYEKQGREYPRLEAYESLQKKLERDIDASEYGFVYSALVEGELITSGETSSFGFDWSYLDGTDLQSVGEELFSCETDAIQIAAETCKRLAAMGDKLRSVGDLYKEGA